MSKIIITSMRFFICAFFLQIAVTAYGQCSYCKSYEDFFNGNWEQLDTIDCKTHSKNYQKWWGGNDFEFTTSDEAMNKSIKKEIFIIKKDDSLYVNCRNLRYLNKSFGNGYTLVRRIGEHSLLFVNKDVVSFSKNATAAGIAGGALGTAIFAASSSSSVKNQYCFVITSGANPKGKYDVRMIDDKLMDDILCDNIELKDEYYSENKQKKRILADYMIPILEKAQLFDY